MAGEIVHWVDRTFYHRFEDNWDDKLFRERILTSLRADSIVLDLGAGSGRVKQMDFRGMCSSVCGLDPENVVLSNPFLDMAKIGNAESIPWPDNTFDIVFADNVLEHLQNPRKVFAEVRRVLKPNGVFFAKTPNHLHYVPIIAQLTPHWFHRYINRIRGRSESDTFPTRYRANSKVKLLALANESALRMIRIERIEGRPEYLRISALLYPFGLGWERLVNATNLLSNLRVLLIAAFQKSENQTPQATLFTNS